MSELTAAEWATPYSGGPPADLISRIAEVVQFVDAFAESASLRADIAVPDRPRIVTILGGRGEGKSTTLVFALEQLRNPGRLVLPVVDPERFAPGDSMLGWVLAHLRDSLEQETLEAQTSSGVTVQRALEDLSRSQALVASRYAEGLAQRGVTPEEYSRDAARLPAEGARFAKAWTMLLDSIALGQAQPHLQIVVPLDDADLHPSMLPSLLADAQALGASPRVVLLIAADEVTLRQALLLAMLDDNTAAHELALAHDLERTRDIRDLIERKIVKHFPRSLRVTLRSVSADSRLDFCPVDRDRTLGELLRSFTVSREGAETLEDLFLVRDSGGNTRGTNDYTRCLSSNRRDLRQLYESLERVAAFGKEAPEALAEIIRHGLEMSRAFSSVPPEEILWVSVEETDDAVETPTVGFKLSGVSFGRVQGFGNTVFRWDDPSRPSPFAVNAISAREVRGQYMRFRIEEAPRDDEDSEDEPSYRLGERAPESLTYLVLLAWEGIQYRESEEDLLGVRNVQGRVWVPGLLSWQNQICHPDPREAPWQYWTVPAWENFSDYFTFSAGWNSFRAHCIPPPQSLSRTDFVEILYLSHIDLVVSVQREHRVPAAMATSSREAIRELVFTGEWASRKAQYLDDLRELLLRTLVELKSRTDMRSKDFVTWFVVGLPLMAVRTTATEELSAWTIDVWRQSEPSDTDRQLAVATLSDVITSHLDDARADAEIDILAQLDEDEARNLRDLREAVGQNREAARAGVLRALQERGVPTDLLDRLRNEGATREVLNSLTLLSWAPEALVDIKRLFPSIREDQTSSASIAAPPAGI